MKYNTNKRKETLCLDLKLILRRKRPLRIKHSIYAD